MTELEIEELKRKVSGSDNVIVAEARSVEALPDQVRGREKCFSRNGSRSGRLIV